MNNMFGSKIMGGKSFSEIEETSQMDELRENEQRTIKERLFGNKNIMDNMTGVNFNERIMGGENYSKFMSGKMNSLDSASQYSERVSLLTKQGDNNIFNSINNPKSDGGFKMNFDNNMMSGTNKVNEYFGNNKVKNKLFSDGANNVMLGGSANNKMFGNVKNISGLFKSPFKGGNNPNVGSKKVNEYLGSNKVKSKLFSDGANNVMFGKGANKKLFGNAKNVTDLFQSPFKKDNNNVRKTVSDVLGFGHSKKIPGIHGNIANKLFAPGAINKFFGSVGNKNVISDLHSKNKIININALTGMSSTMTGIGIPRIGNSRRVSIIRDFKSKNKDLAFTDVDDTVDSRKVSSMQYLGLPMMKGVVAADMSTAHEFKPIDDVINGNNTTEPSIQKQTNQTKLNNFISSDKTGSMEVPTGVTIPGLSAPTYSNNMSMKQPKNLESAEGSRLLMERNDILKQIAEYKDLFSKEKNIGGREQYRRLIADLNKRLIEIDKNIQDIKKYERETLNKSGTEKEKTEREWLKYDFETEKLGAQTDLLKDEFGLKTKEAAFGRARKLEQSILGEELAKGEQALSKERLTLQKQSLADKYALETQRLKDAKQAGDVAFMQSKLQAGQSLMGGLLGGKGQTDLSKVLGANANDGQIARLVATRDPFEPPVSYEQKVFSTMGTASSQQPRVNFEQKVFESIGSSRKNMQPQMQQQNVQMEEQIQPQQIQVRPQIRQEVRQQMQPQVQFQPQDSQYQPQQQLPRERVARPDIDWDRVSPEQAAQVDPEYAKYLAESDSRYRRGPYKKR